MKEKHSFSLIQAHNFWIPNPTRSISCELRGKTVLSIHQALISETYYTEFQL